MTVFVRTLGIIRVSSASSFRSSSWSQVFESEGCGKKLNELMESKGGKKKSSSSKSLFYEAPSVTALKTSGLTVESRNSDQLLTLTASASHPEFC
ncbi:S-adenosylmethionine decarboxylase [Prunus dulcis]|uniref:S-adenosylmethionine decarboxylase n=1 Tax=Prunus dulcis TaxID=3755 RepID=A0A4Y1R7T7_PRUDU|nr:S-adenosylmethionine decarboxylase [Prunus dulcis]